MSDFLDQIWGIDKLFIDPKFIQQTDSQIAAILLSVSPKNYDRFVKLTRFNQIFKDLSLDTNEYSTQLMQVGIINAIKSLKIKRSEVISNLDELSQNNIISFSEFKFLKDFLLLLEIDESEQTSTLEHNFHKNLENLNQIYSNLIEFNQQKDRLNLAYENANNSKFIISVTGVINAGKSSTLNALMNKQILGVSNIPETANLSVIEYSQDEFARVEFLDIKTQKSLDLEPINLEDKNIKIDEIIQYTAASSKFSRYVKNCILGANLDILKDGICIVDTPGLDDAVVWREELTKNYMQKSDFILHLMNAAQSSTKKDMSFICDTLKNTKSAGLVVLLTHADLISQNEIDEVLEYTKKSIESELRDYGFDINLAKSVKFFAVSAKTNQGIDELKNYLYESFFGNNSPKAEMIIDNYKKELNLIAQNIALSLDLELRVLNNDNSLANQEITAFKTKLENISENIKNIQNELNLLNANLDFDINEFSAIKSIISRIKDRIVSDINYSNSKKQKIDFDRIGVICQSGFNDLFIDLFRDFKQKIQKDLDSFYESFRLKFNIDELNFTLPDIKKYFDENISNIGYTKLKADLFNIIKSKFDENEINLLFDKFISNLDLAKMLKNLSNECVADFAKNINQQMDILKNDFLSKQTELENSLNLSINDTKQAQELALNLKSKLDQINQIISRIKNC